MNFIKSAIDDVWIIEPTLFEDQRGHFLEAFRERLFREQGIIYRYVQDNISQSSQGTLRGLHYQKHPHSQSKLVMALSGKVLDVAVDIRHNSATFGQYVSAELSEHNRRMMLIPPGFAHGFSVLSESATIYYKCSNYYDKESERGIRWDDPAVGIDWKVESPLLSDKDKLLPLLSEVTPDDLF